MIGRIRLEEGYPKRGRLEGGHLCDLPVMEFCLPPEPSRKYLEKGCKTMKKQGVRRVLTPFDFPHWDVMESCHLRRVETGDFLRSMGGKLALAMMTKPPQEGGIRLKGERVTTPLYQTAMTLCPQVKTLIIDVKQGGESLETLLQSTFGVPIVKPSHPSRWDVTLDFGGEGEEGEGANTLSLWGTSPRGEPLVLVSPKPLPADLDSLEGMAALWEGNRLEVSEILVYRGQKN